MSSTVFQPEEMGGELERNHAVSFSFIYFTADYNQSELIFNSVLRGKYSSCELCKDIVTSYTPYSQYLQYGLRHAVINANISSYTVMVIFICMPMIQLGSICSDIICMVLFLNLLTYSTISLHSRLFEQNNNKTIC